MKKILTVFGRKMQFAFAAALLLGLMLCLPWLRQQAKTQASTPTTSQQTSKSFTIVRPEDFTTLDEFVLEHFRGRYDPFSLTLSEDDNGNTKAIFRVYEGDKLVRAVLTDRQNSLLYESSELSFPKDAGALDESSELLSPKDAGALTNDDTTKSMAKTMPLSTNLTKECNTITTGKCCGGLSSSGNPYGCCGTYPNDGNCTYAAWELSRRSWVTSLPTWAGDAKTWLTNASSSRIPTTISPSLFSVAVNTGNTSSPRGHVAWVIAVNGPLSNRQLSINEEQCLSSTDPTVASIPYSARTTNANSYQGYILNKNYPSPTISVFGKSPASIYASATVDQQVLFSASNIAGKLKAIVVFPSGYTATLEPSAQIWIYGFQTVGTRMRLSERGNYTIQFFNIDGSRSGTYSFQVN